MTQGESFSFFWQFTADEIAVRTGSSTVILKEKRKKRVGWGDKAGLFLCADPRKGTRLLRKIFYASIIKMHTRVCADNEQTEQGSNLLPFNFLFKHSDALALSGEFGLPQLIKHQSLSHRSPMQSEIIRVAGMCN